MPLLWIDESKRSTMLRGLPKAALCSFRLIHASRQGDTCMNVRLLLCLRLEVREPKPLRVLVCAFTHERVPAGVRARGFAYAAVHGPTHKSMRVAVRRLTPCKLPHSFAELAPEADDTGERPQEERASEFDGVRQLRRLVLGHHLLLVASVDGREQQREGEDRRRDEQEAEQLKRRQGQGQPEPVSSHEQRQREEGGEEPKREGLAHVGEERAALLQPLGELLQVVVGGQHGEAVGAVEQRRHRHGRGGETLVRLGTLVVDPAVEADPEALPRLQRR
eukprot:6187330-Pleurochrysis_carterae.AAC.1